MEPEYKGCSANAEELSTESSVLGNPAWGWLAAGCPSEKQRRQLCGDQSPSSALPPALPQPAFGVPSLESAPCSRCLPGEGWETHPGVMGWLLPRPMASGSKCCLRCIYFLVVQAVMRDQIILILPIRCTATPDCVYVHCYGYSLHCFH